MKALQQVMRDHGVQEFEPGSPRELLQLGYKVGFIDDETVWLTMLKKCNTAVHEYDEDETDEMLLLIRDSFTLALGHLLIILEDKTDSAKP